MIQVFVSMYCVQIEPDTPSCHCVHTNLRKQAVPLCIIPLPGSARQCVLPVKFTGGECRNVAWPLAKLGLTQQIF